MQVVSEVSRLPAMDEYGLLCDPLDWNEAIAVELAQQVGIHKLDEEHWAVIFALRDYYKKFGVAPAMVSICHALNQDGSWVHNLFSTCLNAWIVSGLPNPGEEAKTYLNNS